MNMCNIYHTSFDQVVENRTVDGVNRRDIHCSGHGDIGVHQIAGSFRHFGGFDRLSLIHE